MSPVHLCRDATWAASAVLLLCSVPSGAQQSSLSGKIVTNDREPVAAVAVALHCPQDTHRDAQTVTEHDGSYHFAALAACNYTLSVHADGYSSFVPVTIRITAAQHASRDVVLPRATAAQPADRPAFQAAGIHGLIDPGGYSASATAGAAGNVLHDFSSAQRDTAAPFTGSSVQDCTLLSERIKMAQQQPGDWRANEEVGRSLLQHNSAAAAIPYLQRADKLAPASAVDVRLDLAEALILSGNHREALTRLATLSLKSAGPRFYALRARAEEGLGDFTSAIRDRSEALQQSSKAENFSALAYDHLLAGHVEQASHVLQDGLDRYPQSVSLLVGMGAVQFFRHNVASAMQVLLQAARLDPRDRRPYSLLADISRIPDADTTAVAQAMERHLAIDDDDAKSNAALGSFLLSHTSSAPSNTYEADAAASQRAELLLQHALALDPSLTQARSDLALLYHREHKFGLEAAELARVAAQDPSRDVQYRMGLAYRDSGQPERSKRALQNARDSPDSAQESTTHIASLLSIAPATSASPPCPVSSTDKSATTPSQH